MFKYGQSYQRIVHKKKDYNAWECDCAAGNT